jgi:hypothetical protein
MLNISLIVDFGIKPILSLRDDIPFHPWKEKAGGRGRN